MAPLSYRKMNFEEFCAAAISIYQLEALETWDQIKSTAFDLFEQEGNRLVSVEELARVHNSLFFLINTTYDAYIVICTVFILCDGLVLYVGLGIELGSYCTFDPKGMDSKRW